MTSVTGGSAIRATSNETSAAAPRPVDAPAAPVAEPTKARAGGHTHVTTTAARTTPATFTGAATVPAARAPKRPRCAMCHKRFKTVPGKVSSIYCTESCRKRAKRIMSGATDDSSGHERVSGVETDETPGQTGFSGREAGQLGKETTAFPALATEAVRVEKARSRAGRRYAGRRTLWQITSQKTCKGCGRHVMDPETGIIKAQTAEGYTVVLGAFKCAKIWFCPPCSSSIRVKRSVDVTTAAVKWIRAGGTAYLVTFTPRHAYSDRLDTLMDAIQGTRAAGQDEIAAVKAEIEAVKAELEAAKAKARQAVDAAQVAGKAELQAAKAKARQAVEAARDAAPKGEKRAAAEAARAEAELLPTLKQVREAATAAARAEFEPLIADLERWLAHARDAARAKRRQAGAYQRLITGGTWAGGDEHGEGMRDRIGYIGMIRATEVTVGLASGWHPHIHAIVLLGGRTEGTGPDKKLTTRADGKWDTFEPDQADLQAWQKKWRKVWTDSLEQVDPRFRPSDTCFAPGCKCNGLGHGVDFKQLKTVQDAETFGEYLAKTQDGKDPALELTGATNKDAYGENMTPFQMLNRIGDLMGGMSESRADGVGTLDWCKARWWEYEDAMTGRRAIEWTRHLRQMLGIKGGDTEEDDRDALFELDGASEFRAGVQVKTQAWHDVGAAGLDFEAVQSVAGDGIDMEAVEAVYEAAGAAPGSLRLLTGAEVDQKWQDVMSSLAERREAAAARHAVATGQPAPNQKFDPPVDAVNPAPPIPLTRKADAMTTRRPLGSGTDRQEHAEVPARRPGLTAAELMARAAETPRSTAPSVARSNGRRPLAVRDEESTS